MVLDNERVSRRLAHLCVKWLKGWKIILLGTLVPTALMAVALLLISNKYTASSLLLVNQDQKQGALAKLSAVGGADLASMAGLGANSDLNTVLLLAGSRTLALDAISRFGFKEKWSGEGKTLKREALLKIWNSKFICMENSMGGVEIFFEDTSAVVAAAVVDFGAHWIDSAFTVIKMRQATMSLSFISQMVEGKRKDIELFEDSLLSFQKKKKVFLPTEQLGLSAKSAIELEDKIQQIELELSQVRSSQGRTSSGALALEGMKADLESQIRNFRNGKTGEKMGIMLNPEQNISAAYEFQRLFRNLERQSAVYKQLIQNQELLMIESKKNTPILTIVDKAIPPEKKSGPPKGMILQAFFMFCLIGSTVFVSLRDDVRDFFEQVKMNFGKNL